MSIFQKYAFSIPTGAVNSRIKIDEIITTFNIKRSLSHKGCPYDNAVSEATYKVFKTEFVMNNTFNSLDELKFKLADYVH